MDVVVSISDACGARTYSRVSCSTYSYVEVHFADANGDRGGADDKLMLVLDTCAGRDRPPKGRVPFETFSAL